MVIDSIIIKDGHLVLTLAQNSTRLSLTLTPTEVRSWTAGLNTTQEYEASIEGVREAIKELEQTASKEEPTWN